MYVYMYSTYEKKRKGQSSDLNYTYLTPQFVQDAPALLIDVNLFCGSGASCRRKTHKGKHAIRDMNNIA